MNHVVHKRTINFSVVQITHDSIILRCMINYIKNTIKCIELRVYLKYKKKVCTLQIRMGLQHIGRFHHESPVTHDAANELRRGPVALSAQKPINAVSSPAHLVYSQKPDQNFDDQAFSPVKGICNYILHKHKLMTSELY